MDLQLCYRKNLIKLLKCRNDKIAIYPFGKNGLLLQQILNYTFDIKETMRIDKELSQVNKNILSIEDIENIEDKNEYMYLVTGENTDFYHNLKEKGISDKNIIFMSSSQDELIEFTFIYYIQKYKVLSIYDYEEYFFNKGAIAKNLYHFLKKEYVDLSNISIVARKRKRQFEIYDMVYDEYDDKNIYDLMFFQIKEPNSEFEIQKIIDEHKKNLRRIIFINVNNETINYKKCNLKKEIYGCFEVYIYNNGNLEINI